MEKPHQWREDVSSLLSFHVFMIGTSWREPGFETSWRSLPAPLLEIPSGGSWELWLKGKASPLLIKDHEVLFVPAGKAHRLRCVGERPMRTFILFAAFRWLSHLDVLSLAELPPRLPREAGELLEPVIAEMSSLLEPSEKEALGMVRANELAFKALGIAMGYAGRKDWRLSSPEMARVVKALDLIALNPEEPHSCEALAGEAGLSPSRFRAVFKKATGSAPKAYLRGLRLRQASSLLISSELPVYMVAEECGFSSSFYFCRHFARHVGMPPSAFRKEFSKARGGGGASGPALASISLRSSH